MSKSRKYEFVPLTEDNIMLLQGLYQEVFGISYSLEQIKAKYRPAYTGIEAQGHFAFYQDKAVAFHGAIPVLMNYKGHIELSAQYGDAMTLKDHTGQGLFTRLGELSDERLKLHGVKFVWGFPNQNSEYGYVNKLNWKGKERMRCYIFKLKPLSSELVFRKTKVFEKNKQAQIKKKLKPLIIKKSGSLSIDFEHGGGVDRSDAHYAYKSFSPNYFIQLNETKVWIKTLGGLLVGDMEAKSGNQVNQTILELKKLANELGLNKVVIQASPGSKLNQILAKKYNSIDSWLIGYKNFNSEIPFEELDFTYGDLDTF